MAGNSVSKEELRSYFLEKRKDLSDREKNEKSRRIVDRVLKTKQFQAADTIHSYVSIQKNREVDTFRLIKDCLQMNKKMAVPKIIGEGQLNHFLIDSLVDLRENSWGVPEPVDGKEISVKELDLVIVPMVAGDYFKNRIGYGVGYYDRFLKNCSAQKMGLLFDCQLYDRRLPIENFDIPLDILITESQRIE